MFGVKQQTRQPKLRREGWLARILRLSAARKPIGKKIAPYDPASGPQFTAFTWGDVAAVSRVKQVIATIRAWAYGALGDIRGKAHRLVAQLDTAVRHREAVKAQHESAIDNHDTFRKRVKGEAAEGEFHRAPSVWAKGVFASCVVFATLTLATPVQALGVGIDLGAHHVELARQIGNGLAWLAAFAFGWITASLGKTLGAAPVNWAARNLVKDARVGLRYFWLIPAGGLLALLGSLYAASIVRQGQLELVALHSPIPAWSFAMFTAAIECAAIVLGWWTATPVADADRRLESAREAAEAAVTVAGQKVDELVGAIAAFVHEHDAVVFVAEELERGQFASAAEEIAIRASANPAFYGYFDAVDLAVRAFKDNPAEPLTMATVSSAGGEPEVDNAAKLLADVVAAFGPEGLRAPGDSGDAKFARNGRRKPTPKP